MSCFLDILRCILCVDDEEDHALRRDRNTSYSGSVATPTPTTITSSSSSSTYYTPLKWQSDSQTQVHHHHTPNYSDTSTTRSFQTRDITRNYNSIPTKPPQTSTTRSDQTPYVTNYSSIPTKLPQTAQPAVSSVIPKSTIESGGGVQHKSSPVLTKPKTDKTTPIVKSYEVSHQTALPAVSFVNPKSTIESGGVVQHKSSPVLTNPETVKTTPIVKSYEVSHQPKLPSQTHNTSQPSPALSKIITSSSKPLQSPLHTPPLPSPKSVSSSSSSYVGTPPSSPKTLRPSSKPTLSLAPSNPTNPQVKANYIWVKKGESPIYSIPEDFEALIKKDIVPEVLKKPLSPSTYKDYFHALLYAEDFYIEKWDGFEMENVNLELREAAIYMRKGKYNNWNVTDEKDDKVFVAFEIDSIPEKRPFLLSRDFVFVRPSGKKTEPFKGLIYRVVKSDLVLVEFGEDFHNEHYSACKYDVKFSFNRVCLKRAHQAIAAASDPFFKTFLFPDCVPKNSLVYPLQSFNPTLDQEQNCAVVQILNHQGPPPYLLEGPLSVNVSKKLPRTGLVICEANVSKKLSRTGLVICEAVLQIYRKSPSCRILLCAPTNNTCDIITRFLVREIPESCVFRANAAFRELDGVPFDILPTCLYKTECFSCPSLQELKKFKVIVSTFMSSFRLHNEGIMIGHFSHIFLVDASSVTEPESLVPLANLADERTTVTITGAPRNHSGWVRSNIARKNGLMISYFERLRERKLYNSLDSEVFTHLEELRPKFDDTYSAHSFR